MKYPFFNKLSFVLFVFFFASNGMEQFEPIPKVTIKDIKNESADYIRIEEYKKVWIEGQKPTNPQFFVDYIAPGSLFNTEIKLYKDFANEDELKLYVGYDSQEKLLETIKPSTEKNPVLHLIVDNDLQIKKSDSNGTTSKALHKKTEAKTKKIKVYNLTRFPITLEQPETPRYKGTITTVSQNSHQRFMANRTTKFKFKLKSGEGQYKERIFFTYKPDIAELQNVERIEVVEDPDTRIPIARIINPG